MALQILCPVFSPTVMNACKDLAFEGVLEMVDLDNLPRHIARTNRKGEIAYGAIKVDKPAIDAIEDIIGRSIGADDMTI